ncbi:MAG: lipase family protein [Rickettsiales bacterium]|jgi:hypothetical protein|nr:lipase family protein [Rickettsiales bacterium]
MGLTNRTVEITAWGVSMATYSKNYADHQDKIIELISPDNIMSIKPFFKGDKDKYPAGLIIETKDYVMVSYRGTKLSEPKEVFHDLQIHQSNMKLAGKDYLMHAGFIKEYKASKDNLIKTFAQVDSSKPIIFSGHSLGGAMANIAALDFTANKPIENTKVDNVVTFGAPRVFSPATAKLYNKLELGKKTLRVVQRGDPIPEMVPYLAYKHTGKKIVLLDYKAQLHSSNAYRNITSKLKQHTIENAKEYDGFSRYLIRILTKARDRLLSSTGMISRKEYQMRDRVMREREFKEFMGINSKGI